MTDIPAASKTITYNFIPCTDGDSNNYPVVQIGTAKGTTDNSDPSADKGVQTWMAENLMTTKFKDGTVIPEVTVGSEWYYLKSPAYCWFNNDASTYKADYGALYNWYTVKTGNLCPTGWHVPGDAEWTTLVIYLGGEDFAGGKLKETGLEHWTFPNSGATNETGFTALGAGYRESNGIFRAFKMDGHWWSATEFNNSTAYQLGVRSIDIDTSLSALGKYGGFSVRCLKD